MSDETKNETEAAPHDHTAPEDPSVEFMIEHLRVRTFGQLADHFAHHRDDLEALIGEEDAERAMQGERVRLSTALDALFAEPKGPGPGETIADAIAAFIADPKFQFFVAQALGGKKVVVASDGHVHSPDDPNVAPIPETPAEAGELTDAMLHKALHLLTAEYNKRAGRAPAPEPGVGG